MCILIRHTICENLVKIQYFRHGYSSILCKIRKKLNKIKRLSITCSQIWLFDISELIRYTISNSLVEIQQFRHEWSIIIHENTQKNAKKIKGHAITCSHIWHIDVSKYMYIKKYILWKFGEVMCYQTQMALIFVILFFRHRTVLPSCSHKLV